MTSIRKAKKLGLYTKPTNKNLRLQRETQTLINQANKRIARLKRAGYEDAWASNVLQGKLDTAGLNTLKYTKKGRQFTGLKLNRNLSNQAMLNVNKATREFLQSKTSTAYGIEKVVKKTKNSMYETLAVKNEKITRQDIEDYYLMLGDKNFDKFNTDLVGASTMWGFIDDSISLYDELNQKYKRTSTIENKVKDAFINKLIGAKGSIDADEREAAIRLLEKYVY